MNATTLATMVTQLMAVVLALTIITNIIVQVLKGLCSKLPNNILAFIVALVVTGAAFYVYVCVEGVTVAPWMLVGLLGIAFAVALAAMFGFDKFKEALQQWDELK